MTHQRSHSVVCDGGQRPDAAPCTQRHSWHGTPTVRDVDAYVRNKGWHIQADGRHICPDCWAREKTVRYTSHEELTRILLRSGFELRGCAHHSPYHESWELRPTPGKSRTNPRYVVHLTLPGRRSTRRSIVAHGFAYGGPAETDEHWKGRFASLTAAADWAAAHGRELVR